MNKIKIIQKKFHSFQQKSSNLPSNEDTMTPLTPFCSFNLFTVWSRSAIVFVGFVVVIFQNAINLCEIKTFKTSG